MPDRNTRIRFMANNIGEVASASLTAASALASHPVTNAVDPARVKLYRPAGNFEIATTNGKIYINDGSDKTITLTNGNYTYTTLAAHIQTQLNASSTLWTCTYSSSTYKFTIAHTGSAVLRLSVTTDAAWSTIGYTTSVNLTGTSFVADTQRNHTSETITWDLGAATEIMFFACIGPINDVFSISSSATIKLYANSTNVWTSPALTITLTRDDRGIFQFLDDLAGSTYRYWRFEIIDKSNPLGPEGLKLAHIYLGDYITSVNRNLSSGFNKQYVDNSVRFESEGGAVYSQIKSRYVKFTGMELGYMEASERKELEQMFYDVGTFEAFYVSFDPTLLASTGLSELTRYVLFDDAPVFKHVKNDVFSLMMSLREVV